MDDLFSSAQLSQGAQSTFNDLGELLTYAANSVLLPPERLTVSQAASKYRYLDNEGSYVGPWLNEETPYLVEPMDVLNSRDFESCIFIGPAQGGKTEIILNWIAYTARCDPADFFLIQTARDTARDFSYRRIDKMHRDSREIGSLLRPGNDNDNIFDKFYRNGMMLTLGWPTINQLSGKPVPRVALTDYDRMPQDIEKNGPPFPLARKRTTTFGSFGMTLAESSPSFDVKDPKWKPPRPDSHMFPPTDGIGGLYNEGDRRCFYWQCPHCGEWFEPKFSLLRWDTKNPDPFEASESTVMACPKNGCVIEPRHKYEMNRRGVWLRDGQSLDRDGNKQGVGARSRTASFWLKGPAARFITWQKLVERMLQAQQTFELTAETKALKATINTDQGEPFWPFNATDSNRLPEDLQSNAIQWAEKKVPYGVRFLLATVDVQKNMFVVTVHGIGPSESGVGYDVYMIDRFNIQKSKRKDDAGDTLWVKPYAVQEDWDLITEQVVDKEYELEDGSGFMSIKMTGIDSGGKSGSTTRAYNYWRSMRDNGRGNRVLLIKGEPKFGAPRAEIDYPDSDRKDRSAGARGEVPVLFLNSNVLKDTLLGMLDAKKDGGSRYFFNKWTPDYVYVEMTVEFRNDKGQWQNPSKRRNEAWDLGYYCLGLCTILKVEHFDWDSPDSWYDEWSNNSLVRPADQEKRFASSPTTDYGFGQFGAALG